MLSTQADGHTASAAHAERSCGDRCDIDAAALYATALDTLDTMPPGPAAAWADGLMDAALARDAVARALNQGPTAPAAALQAIAALDARLRAHAMRPSAAAGTRAISELRAVQQPPATAWWCSLDTLATPAPHPLWPVLAGACITLAVSLATDVSLRFLSGGPDLLGLLGTFAQAMLALLAGNAFTRVGGEKAESVLQRLGVPRARHPAWKTLLSALLLFAAVAVWSAMPAIARLYNDHGVRLLQRGEVAASADAFERALRLRALYPQARYNLAVAREELLDHDQAIGDYQRAIRMDERMYPAYNNLARLYLLRKGDGASALALAERGLALQPTEPEVMYTLLKNRGWAQLLLGHLLKRPAGSSLSVRSAQATVARPPAGTGHQVATLQRRGTKLLSPRQLLRWSLPRTAGAPTVVVKGAGVAWSAQMKERIKGVVLPAQAVVRNPSNEPIVWIKSGAERFIPQPVQFRPLDAGTVVVTQGLSADNRVVVQGAPLIAQIR